MQRQRKVFAGYSDSDSDGSNSSDGDLKKAKFGQKIGANTHAGHFDIHGEGALDFS